MKKIIQNTFNKGMNMDLNPLTTPKDVLTDCVNGAIITYDGDEFSLQTDYGNAIVTVTGDDGENKDALPHGFIPLGVKEFNNILYIVAHNPLTGESRVGSFPSPQRYLPMSSIGDPTLYSKSINDVQAESKTLIENININHGMSILTSFLTEGDKFQIMIRLGHYNSLPPWGYGWTESNDILRKFINNYGSEKLGYFDLLYYILDDTGAMIPLNIPLKPTSTVSTIQYNPDPFNNTQTNGVKKVYQESNIGIIVAVLVPKNINSFDYVLKGYNVGGLNGRIIFKKELVDDSNSGIKVYTVKIETSCSNTAILPNVKYFDYYTFAQSPDLSSEVILEATPLSFEEGDIITTICTPLDQFGRDLSAQIGFEYLKVTKQYTVSKYLFGTDAQSIFKYKIIGTDLLLHFDYLNTVGETTDIDNVKVEFYDFWSDVSLITTDIPLNGVERIGDITVPLSSAFPRSLIFDATTRGGIPTPITPGPTDINLLTKTGIVTSLRRDHCYLVRIFAAVDNKEYSVFQLLYTTPIPIFVDNYNLIDNFGTIDIIEGMLEVDSSYKLLQTILDGNLFGGPIINTPVPLYLSSTASYANGTSIEEPYRLYGGPVLEEINPDNTIATWTSSKSYFRDIYKGTFASRTTIENTLGYHVLGEIALKTLNLTDGGVLNSDLFNKPVGKQILFNGLTQNNSQTDFQFKLISDYVSKKDIAIKGTIEITPLEQISGNSLFFGYINSNLLTKKIILGGNTRSFIDNKFSLISVDNITENLEWSETPSYTANPSNKSEISGTITINNINDTLELVDINLYSQRFTSTGSAFASYIRNYSRNKLFSYFSLNHVQSTNVKVLSYADASDINLISGYLFYGLLNNNAVFNIEIEKTLKTITYTTFSSPIIDTIKWITLPNPNLPDLLLNGGAEITGYYGQDGIYNVLPTNASNFFSFYNLPISSVPQDVKKIFRSTRPSHLKINTADPTSLLTTYNHLWKSDTSPFITFDTTSSNDYLSKMVVNQSYQEIIIAQYSDSNVTFNLDTSDTNLFLDGNSLRYTIAKATTNTNSLTKSCFGSIELSPMTISKFQSIVKSWVDIKPENTKIFYNFVDKDISEGLAKNIPWNYIEGTLLDVDLSNITLSLIAGSPESDKNKFVDVKPIMEASSYLENATTVPSIKVLYKGALIEPQRKYFQLIDSSDGTNINDSFIKVPSLIEASVKPVLLPLNSFGLPYYCSQAPSTEYIAGGTTLKIGDLYGGGVIFQLDPTGSDGIQHGKIAGPKDVDGVDFWVSWEESDKFVDATSLYDGQGNFTKMCNNPDTSKYIASKVKAYKEGFFTDWYLPAYNEMKSLLDSKVLQAELIGFYWTSTEYPNQGGPFNKHYNYASGYSCFNTGAYVGGDHIAKNIDGTARPIRKF